MLPLAQIVLDPSLALSLVMAGVTALGAFFAVKFGGAETQRLVRALHSRFDHMEKRQQDLEVQHAVLAERVDHLRKLRTTQRFKMQDVARPEDLSEDEQ